MVVICPEFFMESARYSIQLPCFRPFLLLVCEVGTLNIQFWRRFNSFHSWFYFDFFFGVRDRTYWWRIENTHLLRTSAGFILIQLNTCWSKSSDLITEYNQSYNNQIIFWSLLAAGGSPASCKMPPAVENKFLYALKVKRKVSNEESFNYLWLLVL